MPKDSKFELILSELQELKQDMKAVRTSDIPNLQTAVAGFKEKLKAVESRQTWFSSIATVVGGILAFTASKLTGHS